MSECNCIKIVLTGGPCAGKTTITQVIGRAFPQKIATIPEAATILFSGGFPRWPEKVAIEATQRAIYHLQLELEAAFEAKYPNGILVLDRATVDGAAYWPNGPEDFFQKMGTTLEAELKRYNKVIYLESASEADYLLHKRKNLNRHESWDEAHKLDLVTKQLWTQHPLYTEIPNRKAFSAKVNDVLSEVGLVLPAESRV